MDDRSLKALLARSEREWSGGRGARGIVGFWAVAAAILSGFAAYLGMLTGRAGSLTALPRMLALFAVVVFGGLALYAWARLLRSLGDRS